MVFIRTLSMVRQNPDGLIEPRRLNMARQNPDGLFDQRTRLIDPLKISDKC